MLNDIRLHAKLAVVERKELTQRLMQAMSASRDAESHALKGKMHEAEHRLSVIASSLKSLYVDKCSGKLPEHVFFSLMADFTKEQDELNGKLETLEKQLCVTQSAENEIANWFALIERQIDIQTLDRNTVMELVESIEVSEAVRENGERRQVIAIEYRFIGNLLQNAKEDIA